jgi:hypothetical protein
MDMKIIRICYYIVVVFSLVTCQSKKDNDDILLTDFTKEFISLYINDIENVNVKDRSDDIIIISFTDTSYYCLSIFANNSKSYKFCRNDFVGKTVFLGHLIRVFGNKNSIFYSKNEDITKQKPCKANFIEYDPSIWQVCFHKDEHFCKMKTYKVTADGDISKIQRLAEKFFGTSDIPVENNNIYQNTEVEIAPQFLLGEDSLRNLISSNFKIKKKNVQDKMPVIVDVVIDKNGEATLKGVKKSSNDIEIDNEALRIAKIVCQYKFIPAIHRGENVNAIFPIVFLKNDINSDVISKF